MEAFLWAAPTGGLPKPPIDTKAQVLPIAELEWPDAERLFLRLLHTVRPVQYAKLFGVPGQAQAGIDAYARLPVDLTRQETGGQDYITLQSRRVKSLTPTRVKKAVDDLLKGEWGTRTTAFHFATSFDLQDTRLDSAIRTQTERLAELDITFVPWGVQEVSALLKDQPRIVDDFFGRPWVERFCGAEAALALADNLPSQDNRELHAGLRDLYRAVFHAQGEGQLDSNDETDQRFVILDVDPARRQANVLDTARSSVDNEGQRPTDDQDDGHVDTANGLAGRRPSFRSARKLLTGIMGPTPARVGTVKADEWLAGGEYRLLIGQPGAGKSSLLRFAAADLLSLDPQSAALQREHATDLPIWLPFGFLCRHLEASTDNSLVSAAEAWLKSQSATYLWPLVQRALRDDRLLLLIDGIDEWSEVGAAEHALGILEAFLGRTNTSAILSTRPYAVDRLNWRLPWARAEITPLTDDQRRRISARALTRAVEPDSVLSAQSTWNTSVDTFLSQLLASPELEELARSPLFLTLLAATWQGEPLPRQRFKIYGRLVGLLIEKHPQMRQRASHAGRGPLTANEMTTLFTAVAYRLRLKDPTGTVSKPDMRRLIVESMTDDEVLGYEQSAARRIVDRVLDIAEDEFGLIVSHGGGAVGFLHRVLLDHMAGLYLATLTADEQVGAIRQFTHDPAWRDVLLALLTAQVSPHATEQLLSAALNDDDRPWADIDGHELLAQALSADVRLTPRQHNAYTNVLVERIESHPSSLHRANIITALVGTLASHSVQHHLRPAIKRWLNASRPYPARTMWALRDLPITDEAAAKHLLWGIRYPEDDVKVEAALAIAHRFGGRPQFIERLVSFTETGPSSTTQAAAILALGTGWPDEPETIRLIAWARRQPSVPVRMVGLHLLQQGTPSGDASLFRAEERDWLLSLVRREDLVRGPWPVAELVNIAAAGVPAVADFMLETLQTNGRTGGDRGLAWILACGAFADDSRFKNWVATQLAAPDQYRLILFNVGMIPQLWRDDPAFTPALRQYLDNQTGRLGSHGSAELAVALPGDDARTILLRSLNSWRPYAAARTLVERYADHKDVQSALSDRLHGEYSRAAPMAGVAIDVLGPTEGFAILASLLRQPADGLRSDDQAIVAEAVAEAWKRLEAAARQSDADADVARQVLAAYDPVELAALCTTVDTHPLTWHVPAVISAWPEQAAVQNFAIKFLQDPTSAVLGIADSIPVAILKAYSGRTDETSVRIVNTTLAMFAHLEPELREVLVFELARSSMPTDDLLDIMKESRDDPDAEVRRHALIGLAEAIKRHQRTHGSVTDAQTPEMDWLRTEVRKNLCAYGPQLEERRQLAWIVMLLLDDLTLTDGIQETIGHAGQPPGVQLNVFHGDGVDHLLVELVSEKWSALCHHFGDSIFDRLTSTSDRERRPVDARRRAVMSALAAAASHHPDVAEMLRQHAHTDDELRHDRRFLLWAKDENRGTEATLRALVAALSSRQHDLQDQITDSLLDRDSWDVSDQAFKDILTDESVDTGHGHVYHPAKLAIYTQLFPTDAVSVAALEQLQSWFRSDSSTREPREWDDTLAIAFGVADPRDLPAIAVRVYTRVRMGLADQLLSMFTQLLLRRLRVDDDAVEAFRVALGAPMDIQEDSPLFTDPWDPISDACPDQQPMQRTYLFALVLHHAGALPQQDAESTFGVLTSASPQTVVLNPFTAHEGPLRLAALDLVDK